MIVGLRGRLPCVLALAAVMVFPASVTSPIAADSGTDLTGTVLHQDGISPARNVTVRLRDRTSGQEFSSRQTDATGRYEIQEVPDGEYTIVVSTGGGEFMLPSRVTIAGGQPSSITLIMTPAASEAAGSSGSGTARSGGKAAILIPTIGGILVAAFAADQLFEKDEDASPKLP